MAASRVMPGGSTAPPRGIAFSRPGSTASLGLGLLTLPQLDHNRKGGAFRLEEQTGLSMKDSWPPVSSQ